MDILDLLCLHFRLEIQYIFCHLAGTDPDMRGTDPLQIFDLRPGKGACISDLAPFFLNVPELIADGIRLDLVFSVFQIGKLIIQLQSLIVLK